MTAAQDARTLQASRIAARWFLNHACNGMRGRAETDPIYQGITEGRDVGRMQQKYSSCGDLAHWLLWRLGVRLQQVNREERKRDSEGTGWRMGQNVSQLVSLSNALKCGAPCVSDGDSFDAGDILIVWNNAQGLDAHVICVTERYANRVLPTAEYGQPGGKLFNRTLTPTGEQHFAISAREVQIWLPLGRVLEAQGDDNSLLDLPLLRTIAPAEIVDEILGLFEVPNVC